MIFHLFFSAAVAANFDFSAFAFTFPIVILNYIYDCKQNMWARISISYFWFNLLLALKNLVSHRSINKSEYNRSLPLRND